MTCLLVVQGRSVQTHNTEWENMTVLKFKMEFLYCKLVHDEIHIIFAGH